MALGERFLFQVPRSRSLGFPAGLLRIAAWLVDEWGMKYATDLLRNAPGYLIFICAFAGAVAFGLFKLYAILQSIQG